MTPGSAQIFESKSFSYDPDMVPEHLEMLPRSFMESPGYRPEWRHLQIEEYTKYVHEVDSDANIERWEKDEWILKIWNSRMYGINESHMFRMSLKFCDEAWKNNSIHDVATRIKAYLAAGADEVFISDRLGVNPSAIEIFKALYFDISDIQSRPEVMRVVCVGSPQRDILSSNSSLYREKVWLTAAITGGLAALDLIMNPVPQMDSSQMEFATSCVSSMLTRRAMERGVLEQVGGVPTGSSTYAFLEMTKTKAIEEQLRERARRADEDTGNVRTLESMYQKILEERASADFSDFDLNKEDPDEPVKKPRKLSKSF